jgi:hypothetical protein
MKVADTGAYGHQAELEAARLSVVKAERDRSTHLMELESEASQSALANRVSRFHE